MRTPKEAIAEILSQIAPLEQQEMIILADAAGRILAQQVTSDVNLPPFEKSMMDGYAVRSSDTSEGAWNLRKLGESRAGEAFSGSVGPGECIAIYTGAEMPEGADAVVMIERTREEGDRMHSEGVAREFLNVAHKGEVLAEGRSVLSAGRRLDAVDLALLAAVGCDPVPVIRRPRLSILTTGDELVPAGSKPGPAQIREGNTVFLAAAAKEMGVELLEIGIVPDSREQLEVAFARALDAGGGGPALDDRPGPAVAWATVAGPELVLRPLSPDAEGRGAVLAANAHAACDPGGTCVDFSQADALPSATAAAAARREAALLRLTHDRWYRRRQVGMVAQLHLVPRLTPVGFARARLPPALAARFAAAYTDAGAAERAREQEEEEPWQGAVQNQYHAPTLLRRLPPALAAAVAARVRALVAAWAGLAEEALERTSVYGVRTYRGGALVRMHLDRLATHVLSAVVHVANNLRGGSDDGGGASSAPERWPLRVFGHDGEAHDVALRAPGDVLLYESARCAHGRPRALPAGRSYANLFVHFRPRGWVEEHPDLGALIDV